MKVGADRNTARLLGDLVHIQTGKLDANAQCADGMYPFFTCAKTVSKIDSYSYECECVLVAGNGDLNTKYYNGRFDAYQRTYIIQSADKGKLDVRYLYHFLETYVEKLRKGAIGGVIKYIKLGHLTDIKIPLPPLPEQKRIAAILDKADAIRRKRRESIRLTEEFLRSVFLDMFGDPVTNPKGWDVVRVGDALEAIESGWSVTGEQRTKREDEWGVLKISAVTWGRYQPGEHKVVQLASIDRDITIPKRGDLLFTRANTRELVAACCLVDTEDSRLFLPDKIWRIVPDRLVTCSEYLRYLFEVPRFRDRIARQATGTSGSMLNVSMRKLRVISMPIPPLPLQRRFKEIVWQDYKLRRATDEGVSQLDTFLCALVQKAFRGQL